MPDLAVLPAFCACSLADPFMHNFPSKIRSGMLLGRGHRALGQHSLAVSALDAALGLTKVGGWTYLLLSFLVIRERAAAGIAADGKAPHWSRYVGEQQLTEAVERLHVPGDVKHALLEAVLPPQQGPAA